MAATMATGCVEPAWAGDGGLTPAAATRLGSPTGPSPETGAVFGPFLVYPQLILGGVYNDNIAGAAFDKAAGFGVRLAPSLSAIDDEGLHKTSLRFDADAQLYPGAPVAAAQANQLTMTLNGDEVWSPADDLTVDLNGGYVRNNSPFGSLNASAAAFVTGPTAAVATYSAQYYDLLSANGSVRKLFGDGFSLKVGGGVGDAVYEQAPAGAPSPLSGLDYNGFARGGYRLIPDLTGFVEAGADLRRYRSAGYDSDAYRLIGGVSSELIGLFRGEAFAGYQTVASDRGAFGPVSSPTYGATVFYYPTVALTLAASLDRAFGAAAASPSAPTAAASSAQVWEGRLQGDYAMAAYWTASARAGFARTAYANAPAAAAWTAGFGVAYNFWRNVGLTLDYDYTRTTGDAPGANGYTRNVVSAGLTYRY